MSGATWLRDVAQSISEKFVKEVSQATPSLQHREYKELLKLDQQLPSGLEELLIGLRGVRGT
jgi:hypothetical protein